MTILRRDLLARAFPNNPRLVAELEEVDDFLTSTSDRATEARGLLNGLIEDLGEGGKYQRATRILEAISGLVNRIGAVELTADDQATVRPIDSKDPVSLLSRGVAYTVLVGIAGRGTTAARPAVPENAVAVYFDTTLAAEGKPIFWTGVKWVDATGVVV